MKLLHYIILFGNRQHCTIIILQFLHIKQTIDKNFGIHIRVYNIRKKETALSRHNIYAVISQI